LLKVLVLIAKETISMSLENFAQKVGVALKKQGKILCTAESCTAGGLSYYITSIDGSSHWFERGFVTYSDASKIEMLNVRPATLETHGAVSEATAREMAEGALAKSYADISIAITGIAGPTGEAPGKPIGMVWFAWAGKGLETRSEVKQFTGSRKEIREQSIEFALSSLLAQSP